MVAYDLLRIPVRAGLLLGIAAGIFGVPLRWLGLSQALVIAFAGEFADRSRSDPEYASKLDRLSQYGRIFK